MSKVTLNDISNGFSLSTVSKINQNNTLIEDAIDNSLSRDGSHPNAMEADLDMNSNQILNLPEAVEDTEPVRKLEFDEGVTAAEQAAADAANSAAQAIQIVESITGIDLGTIGGLPVQSSDFATKEYADLVSGANNLRVAVRLASTAPMSGSPVYTAATTHARAKLVATTNGTLSIDSVATNNNDRVLLKNEVTSTWNDVWIVEDKGSPTTKWTLRQAAELDNNQYGEILYVSAGSVNADKFFLRSSGNITTNTGFMVPNDGFATSGQLNAAANAASTLINTANSNISSNTSRIASLESQVSSGVVTASSITTFSNKTIDTASNTLNIAGNAVTADTGTGAVARAVSPAFTGTPTFGGVALAASATTNALNASNISSGTLPDARLSNIISASTAGDSSHVPVITWDAHGRLTSVSSAAISSSSFTVGIVAPGINGIIGDGADTGDKTDIDSVISASGIITFYPGTYLIDVDKTWPGDKLYVIHPGAYIKVSAGKTLTINGAVSAGDYKIFGNTGSAGFDLLGTVSGVKSVRPDWWGCKRDAVTDDYSAIQSAINCAQARTGSSQRTPLEIQFSSGYYATATTLKFKIGQTYPWSIRGVAPTGDGNYGTWIYAKAVFTGGAAIELDGSSDSTADFEVCNLYISNTDYTAGPAWGLYIHDSDNGFTFKYIHDIVINNFSVGILMIDCRMFNFTRVAVWNTHDDIVPVGLYMTASAGASPSSVKFVGDTDFYHCQFVCGSSQNVRGAANNGGGLVRLTVGTTSNLFTGQSVTVSNVGGTTEANGTWIITVIDATHIDLQGSVFVHAYTSGGSIDGLSAKGTCALLTLPNVNSMASGIRFNGCLFYYGSNSVTMSAGAANTLITDIWINPGCQHESHNFMRAGSTVTANTITLSATGNPSQIDNIQINGTYMVGYGWNKNLVASVGAGGVIFAVQFKNNFCNNTFREGIDIRGTSGSMYGVQINDNIWRGVSSEGASLHNAIYVENVDHVSVNNNSLIGSGYTADNMIYFNSGGLFQVASGNNSAGRYSGAVVATSAPRAGQLFAGLNV